MRKNTHTFWIMLLFVIIHYQTKAQIELVADLAPGTELKLIGLAGENEKIVEVNGNLLFFLAGHPLYGTELWKMGADEQVTLVKDLNPGPGNVFENGTIAVYNDYAYFVGSETPGITNLYRTDGYADGTFLIKELYETEIDGFYYSHIVNGKLLIQISIGEGDQDVWVTNGTTEGTYLLASDISIAEAVNIGNKAIVSGYDETNGTELWITDGTDAGTSLLKDIYSGVDGSYPAEFYASSYGIIFHAQNDTYGEEIWVTDGTNAGTVIFADINPGAEGGQPKNFIEFDGEIYFQAREVGGVSGNELWKSDGTAMGTTLVKDIFPSGVGSAPENFYVFDGSLYFTAQGNSTFFELYKSDGTDVGTVLVKDINTSGNSNPRAHFSIGSNHYFFAYDNTATGLWTTDGTEGGTTLIKHLIDASVFPSNLKSSTLPVLFNGAYYFGLRGQIWKTDGTALGTVEINHNINAPRDSDPLNFIQTPIGTFFAAFVEGAARLYVTDGNDVIDLSEAGFILDGEPGEINSDFIFYNNQLIFAGYTDTEGGEPWITDGTIAGTHMIKDVNTIDLLSSPAEFFEFNGKVYFRAKNAAGADFELFVTDGTEAGTSLVKDIYSGAQAGNPNGFMTVGSNFIFEANTAAEGSELWKSDGTEVGTVLLKDIRTGSPGSTGEMIGAYFGRGLFTAYTDAEGTELWTSDGTDAGTEILYNIGSGANSGNIDENSFYELSSKVIFTANDQSIWATNGTPAGTERMLSTDFTDAHYKEYSAGIVNDKYVFIAYDDNNDYHLFSTDGTTANTILIMSTIDMDFDVLNDIANNERIGSTNLNGKLYFSTGVGVIATDGTLAGTSFFNTDSNGSSFIPLFVIALNEKLYFSGYEEGSVTETLFVSDGTAAGTSTLLTNGVATHGPFEAIGDYIYFNGYEFDHGNELYRFNTAADFQEITFAAIDNKYLADGTLTLSASASSGLEVSYEIISGPATVSGNVITFTGLGTVTVTASQAGNGSYHPAIAVSQSFEVLISDQTITFDAIADQLFSSGPLTLSASASSGLDVAYEIVSGPATVSGNVVTFTGIGMVTVSASQAGNDAYNAATAVEQSFTIFKNEQTITFGAIEDQFLEDGSITLSASASSGLAVSYSITSGSATVSGNVVSYSAVGTVVVKASQAGNDSFLAATPVEQSFEVVSITGVENELASLLIYPNPTSDVLTVQTLEQDLNIVLLNSNGAEVMTVKANTANDLSGLTRGLYLLRISTAKQTTVHKIIKN